jgi:hypothetical protein
MPCFVMVNVAMMNVIILSVIMLNVVMLRVFMLNVVMLRVVVLSVVMLSILGTVFECSTNFATAANQRLNLVLIKLNTVLNMKLQLI